MLKIFAAVTALLVCASAFGQDQKITCLPPGCPPIIFTPTRTLSEYTLSVPSLPYKIQAVVPASLVLLSAYLKTPTAPNALTILTIHDEQPPWKPGPLIHRAIYITAPGIPVPMDLDLRLINTIVKPDGTVYVVFEIVGAKAPCDPSVVCMSP